MLAPLKGFTEAEASLRSQRFAAAWRALDWDVDVTDTTAHGNDDLAHGKTRDHRDLDTSWSILGGGGAGGAKAFASMSLTSATSGHGNFTRWSSTPPRQAGQRCQLPLLFTSSPRGAGARISKRVSLLYGAAAQAVAFWLATLA